MITRKVKVVNPTGLHLHPAGALCELADKYESFVHFKYGDNAEANAKSVLSILGACVRQGDEIELVIDGVDEEEAMEAITRLIESGFVH
ncbi:MAG: HPr family phosphocarrier protein [Lachnospiraceae bacterium]|nr:HPr family phosphocarrier protein [Lachnospiraceae bacterium]